MSRLGPFFRVSELIDERPLVKIGDVKMELNDFNYNWFMSVDFRGKWTVVNGSAYIEMDDDDQLVGYLCLSGCESNDRYLEFKGTVTEDNFVQFKFESVEQGVPSFDVSGKIYDLETDKFYAQTIILTDGTTVIGLSAFENLNKTANK